METRFDAERGTLTCSFEGSIRSDECPAIHAEVLAKLEALGARAGSAPPDGLKVVFDLGSVEYVSSAFLSVLLMTARRVKKGNLAISNANAFVHDILTTVGLDRLARITSLKRDAASFPPPPAFAATARLSSAAERARLHAESLADPEGFWGRMAGKHLAWFKPWERVLDWQPPNAKWFVGGRLNACYNCLDRHLGTPTEHKAALIWEGEMEGRPGQERVLTYRELFTEVCRFANALKRLGVGKGDRVLIYMPMTPEACVAMLACARIGAIHSVVFGGFSAQAVAERVQDCGAKAVVTADGGRRRGEIVPLKANVDAAMTLRDDAGRMSCATVRHVVVLRQVGVETPMTAGRDVWWHEIVAGVSADCPPEVLDSEDVLFILYTSGSTGKPKGVFHTTAGYLLGVKLTHEHIFDIRDSDVYWCTADIGWITGHSYVVYGPLANGATVVIYEGAPNYPSPDRFWRIVAKRRVTILYTAPTAIRAFMKWGDEWPARHDLSSLRLLGTVGEPINPEAWLWYHRVIGGGRCPIVDTWWQTETGAIMIAPLPGATATKPGSATLPFFGVDACVADEHGAEVPSDTGGALIIRRPWPSMLRGVWGDPRRYEWTYWKDIPGVYSTGDGAKRDSDGYLWIVGRLDDVLKVSGHRIGTAEVESALVSHPSVAEAAAVGRPDDIKGSAIVVFVTLRSGHAPGEPLREELRQHVAQELGAVARPDEVRFAEALPKTRSGKIMRRLLRQVAAGGTVAGDMTTLEDFNVLAGLMSSGEEG